MRCTTRQGKRGRGQPVGGAGNSTGGETPRGYGAPSRYGAAIQRHTGTKAPSCGCARGRRRRPTGGLRPAPASGIAHGSPGNATIDAQQQEPHMHIHTFRLRILKVGATISKHAATSSLSSPLPRARIGRDSGGTCPGCVGIASLPSEHSRQQRTPHTAQTARDDSRQGPVRANGTITLSPTPFQRVFTGFTGQKTHRIARRDRLTALFSVPVARPTFEGASEAATRPGRE